MSKFTDLLATEAILLGDGAMGTMLFAAGLESGGSPELWNVEQPERVMAVHRAYAEAGTNLILTNSFGGTSYRLNRHGLQGRVYELNRAAAEIARKAVEGIEHPVLIGGSVGPTGEMLEPLGDATPDALRQAFAEQATGLRDGGVDYFQIETMSDLGEVEAAVEGIRSVSDLPIAITMSFDTNRRTMMGVKPETAAQRLVELGAAAIGSNCGSGVDDTLYAVEHMIQAAPGAVVIAKSNAGLPQIGVDGKMEYNGTPEVMVRYALQVRNLGVRIIGACCGSTPAHIRAMRDALRAG